MPLSLRLLDRESSIVELDLCEMSMQAVNKNSFSEPVLVSVRKPAFSTYRAKKSAMLGFNPVERCNDRTKVTVQYMPIRARGC